MRFRNLLILFLLILSCNSEIKNNPQAIKGEIDLRKWEFQKDGIINLDGEWDFYWDALLTPEDFEKKEIFSKEYIKFPDTWNDKIWEGKKLSSNGYATFRLKVKFKENEKPIAFRFREQATAFKVFWNNK
ncbi:MAG: hypothetical protein KDK36_16840, partial [Leptospiraceae bacterium]|nr:hypothetical protein [Leptospiraceae bacterium]